MPPINDGPIVRSDAELLLVGIHEWLKGLDAKIRGVPLKRAKATTENGLDPRPPWDWLLCGLGVFTDLLEIAPEWMPVKQFLETFLRDLPVSEKRKPRLNAALARLRSTRWTALLDLDCEVVALLLRQLISDLKDVKERHRRWEEQLWNRTREDEKTILKKVRTPVPFFFKGKSYRFPYRQSLLLECLQDGNEVSAMTAIEHIWGGWEAGVNKCSWEQMANRLHQLESATKKALKRKKLPFNIIRPEANYLRMI
jgi:hypothetical protein